MTDSTERSVSFAQARAILARTSLLFRPYRGTIAVIVVTILVASGATLYERLKRMPLRFFTATRTGEVQSRLTNDVSGIDDVITHVAQDSVANIVILVSSLVAMLVMSWQVTVLSFAIVPVFAWFTSAPAMPATRSGGPCRRRSPT